MSALPPAVARTRLAVALFLPPLSWFLFQQGLNTAVALRCTSGGVPTGPICGAAALLACGFAAWLARPNLSGRSGATDQVGRFLALLAVMGAGLFMLAIAFQTMATLIIPPCVR